MWIETIEGGLVNTERAIGIHTNTQGTRHEVDIEVSTQHPARNPLRTIFRGDDAAEFNAFMDDLKATLPMLPIGTHTLAKVTGVQLRTKTPPIAKTIAPPRKAGEQIADTDEV